jgi:hypothetical protein
MPRRDLAAAVLAAACLAFAAALTAGCALTAEPPPRTVALSVAASAEGRAVGAAFAASLATLDIAVSSGGGLVEQRLGVAYGAAATFNLTPGVYTAAVNARNGVGALAGAGSLGFVLMAVGNQTVTVPLSFAQTAAGTGSFSLPIRWPTATNFTYVRATLNGAALPDPAVGISGVNHTATLIAAGLSGGRYILDIYFRPNGASAVEVGPFTETVNIWDGVLSARWIAPNGAGAAERLFAATEFPDSTAALAGLALTAPAIDIGFTAGDFDYSFFNSTAASLAFTVTPTNPRQSMSYTWNGVPGVWAGVSGYAHATGDLAVDAGNVNTLSVVVTAPDRQTTRTYTVTVDTNIASFNWTAPEWNFTGTVSAADLTTIINNLKTASKDIALDLSGAAFTGNTLPGTFTAFSRLTELTLPASITSLSNGALSDCPKLTTLVVPDAVTTIASNVLIRCNTLRSVTLSAGVVSTGSNMLAGCPQMQEILVDPANTVFSSVDGVLYSKDQKTIVRYPVAKVGASYTILAGVTRIGGQAFYSAAGLSDIVLPATLTAIDSMGLYGCSNLLAISLPAGLTTIGGNAFANCTKLTTIDIPAAVATIDSGAFEYNASLTAINIEPANANYSSVDGIMYNKAGTTLLACPGGKTALTIPAAVTVLADRSLMGCSKLTTLTIPATVTSIGYYEFSGCAGLTTITIPSSITAIPYGAFQSCSNLATVYLPATTASIGSCAFLYCSNLAAVHLGAATPPSGIDSYTFQGNKAGRLIYVPAASLANYQAVGGNWQPHWDAGSIVGE